MASLPFTNFQPPFSLAVFGEVVGIIGSVNEGESLKLLGISNNGFNFVFLSNSVSFEGHFMEEKSLFLFVDAVDAVVDAAKDAAKTDLLTSDVSLFSKRIRLNLKNERRSILFINLRVRGQKPRFSS